MDFFWFGIDYEYKKLIYDGTTTYYLIINYIFKKRKKI